MLKNVIILHLILSSYAFASQDYIIEPVKFYPNKSIGFFSSDKKIVQNIQSFILRNYHNYGISFTKEKKSDYVLDINYVTSCGSLVPKRNCSINVFWKLLRHDMAPVGLWQSSHPLDITNNQVISSRFKYVIISSKTLMKISSDFMNKLKEL